MRAPKLQSKAWWAGRAWERGDGGCEGFGGCFVLAIQKSSMGAWVFVIDGPNRKDSGKLLCISGQTDPTALVGVGRPLLTDESS